MVHGGGVCLRGLSQGSRAFEVRVSRFLANTKVTVEKLIDGWSAETTSVIAGRHILAIQDTSELNFRTSSDSDRGLGLIGKGVGRGVLLHPMIAVDAESGACLGLVGGHIWTRGVDQAKPAKRNQQRPLSDKETRFWLETAQAAKSTLSAAKTVTMIADREADFYHMWALVPDETTHVLGRVYHDRAVVGGGSIATAARSWAVQGTREIIVRERHDRPERAATLHLRYGQITISRPEALRETGMPDTATLTLIELSEPNPPENVEPVSWRLLTSHTVSNADDAWQIVDWYRCRWIIEQLFRTLKKQGLQIEDSQVNTAERLMKLVAIATRAAIITIQLVQARDGQSAIAASLVFERSEIDVIDRLNKTQYAGKTKLQQNPHQTGSIAWAGWIVARLGGWDGYPSSKLPGPITFKRGQDQLKRMAQGWALRDVCMP